MISGHLDGRSGGDGFDDDGSAVALLLEIARVLSAPDVTTDKSVRFIFWDKEETGLVGSTAYASNTTSTGGRRALQGTLDEPTWLGLITHDMILYDHGAGTRTTAQSAYADLDVELRAGTTKEADSKAWPSNGVTRPVCMPPIIRRTPTVTAPIPTTRPFTPTSPRSACARTGAT